MSLGLTANRHKNGVLLAYIANKIPNIHLRKLLKVVYLIDEHFTLKRGFPLTWFDYFAWAKGPVAPEVYAIKDGAFSDRVVVTISEEGKRIVNSVERHEFLIYNEMDDFSESEISEIDMLLAEFGEKTADELSDITHIEDSLWSKTVANNHIEFNDRQRTSPYEIHLNNLFSDDDVRQKVYAEAKWNMEFQAMLNQKRAAKNV